MQSRKEAMPHRKREVNAVIILSYKLVWFYIMAVSSSHKNQQISEYGI